MPQARTVRNSVATTAVRSILFGMTGPDGKPLFANARRLAEVLVYSLRYGSNVKSLASFISQLLGQSSRPVPTQLRIAIEQAVRARLKSQPYWVQEDWLLQLDSAFAKMEALCRGAGPFDFSLPWYEMLESAAKAKEHLVLCMEPPELMPSRPASDLHKLLCRQVGLPTHQGIGGIESLSTSPNDVPPPVTRYTFVLPSRKAGEAFWRDLLRSIVVGAGSTEHGRARLQDLLVQRDFSDHLRVFHVDPIHCVHPMRVFNPTLQPTAYVVDFNPRDPLYVGLVRMQDAALHFWLDKVYWHLRDNVLKETNRVRPG